ncbi:class I SAM-dependent methyltransferase [Streptomyces cavernae]|uniref:class I SAM-dependent methyltransferase n=1 Tax=Streptomyces cavernae TaxID=2259034 RepID=UPI001391B71B|nr:class I SAM-dependent methyltransferase [Streptomyces cavernae]
MSQPDYDRAAREWDRLNSMPQPVSDAIARCLPTLPPGALVLDLGCGTGEPGFTIKSAFPDTRLLGVDASEPMIEMARAKAQRDGLTGTEFKVMQMEDLAVGTGEVDVLVSRFGFLSVHDTAAEAARVLRPGGHYAMAVWDRSELNTAIHVFFTVLKESSVADEIPDLGIFDVVSSDARREQWLRDAGMASIDTELFAWSYTLPDFDAVLETLAAPPFGAAVATLDDDETKKVQEQIFERLSPHRAADGSYRIPQTCRLYWGQR